MSVDNSGNKEEKQVKKPKGYKLTEYHTNFICKKLAEENMCGTQIADLFNSVFGKNGKKGGVTISYVTVYSFKNNPKYQPIINDYKMQYAKCVDKNRYTDLAYCSEVLKELIEDARANKKHKEACTALQLLATLNGNITEKVAVEYSDADLAERIKREKEKQKVWLVEYKEPEELKESIEEPEEPKEPVVIEKTQEELQAELNDLEAESQYIIDDNTLDGQKLF